MDIISQIADLSTVLCTIRGLAQNTKFFIDIFHKT
nr:MAG TPA: protein of unknown function DUF2369 [Caudoviricetes sp.]